MKTIKSIIVLSLLALLLCSEAAFAEQVWRCQHCGKVAEGSFGKFSAGICSNLLGHYWVPIVLDHSDYKKQMKETERKKQQEFQQWHYGHMQGWW